MMHRCDSIEHRAKRAAFRAAWASILAGAALLLVPTAAHAHAIGLSRGEYRVTGEDLDVTLVLARAEATAAVPDLDANGRGTFDKVRVTAAAADCAGTLVGTSLTEQDGFEIRARYRCPPSDAPWTVTLPLLDDLSHGHRHAAHVVGGTVTSDHLLSRSHATFTVERPAAAPTSRAASTTTASTASAIAHWGGFVGMGMEHILSGYDHLLFLLALVLAGGTIRSLALAVTSFTVAHSVTLALAVLGFVVPSARWIEPAIALSVAYVGLENFFPRRLARPWVTFPFGLVHGFGFAGALEEIALSRSEVPWALLSFNVGVELGQLAWMIALGLLVAHLRRRPWFVRRAVPVMSALIVAIGLVWFVGRLHVQAIDFRGVACAGVGWSQQGTISTWCG